MPDYNFLNLSPPEFEDLTRDLLQKYLQITLESFASGRDGGIDLRHSISLEKTLIIQCKRYKDYNALIRNLEKELPKVNKLSPVSYIVSTTVDLTPHQKDVILTLFKPFILSTSDILGRSDLNNLLGIYPEIEKVHFKLWLSSSNILDRLLNSKIYNQSNFEEESIKNTINLYVDNESYYKANNIIKEKKYVIISGIPGIGKTTLARILVYHYLANGFDEFIFLSDSINDGYTSYREGKKQIFLFDDFLGTNFLENKLNTNEEQRIVKFIEKVSKSLDKIIIMTTREYILVQAKQKYDIFNNPLLEFGKCILDLSQYTKIVRAKILYNHLFFSNLSEAHIQNLLKTNTYQTIIDHPNYNPRIIQTITNDDIWKTIDPSDFSNKFVEFIKNPQSVWKHSFENQISKLSQCILANLMTIGTLILLEDLKAITKNFVEKNWNTYRINYNEIEFKKSVKELENTFVEIRKDSANKLAIEYQNPSVQDFLVFYFREYGDYIRDIIISAKYFNQLFQIFSYDDSKFIPWNQIPLDDELKQIAIHRIISDFDILSFVSLTGSRYQGWGRSSLSDYIKLNEIITNLTVASFPDLHKFTKIKFEKMLYPKELHGNELKCYINLLNEFYLDLEVDEFLIISQLSQSIHEFDEIYEIRRLEVFFPDEFNFFIVDNPTFCTKIFILIEDEADNTDDNLEDKLTELKSLANAFRVDIEPIERKIEEKIKKQEKENTYGYNWSNENNSRISTQKKDDNKTIKDIFDSLRTRDNSDVQEDLQ
ncbi:MAG: restriction endonuclease [Dyadobacter sp.]|uniref:nSTAND3 domain-containing NTPase n=1 Tax=Dyadobacter sp. TaxID=1914288 RepID=UPI0032661842